MASEAKIDNAFLELLKQFDREGRNVTAKKGPSYAPAEFANHSDAKDINKDAFKKSMDRLLKDGKIESKEYGPPSRQRSKLVTINHRQENDD